jgi:anti-anti-sigma factor
MDNSEITDERGTTLGSGHAVTRFGSESMVRAWGGWDTARAWLLRECLDEMVATGQRKITLDVSKLRFGDFTAVAVLVGALARVRRSGAEVAVFPESSGAYRVLKRADPIWRTTSARLPGRSMLTKSLGFESCEPWAASIGARSKIRSCSSRAISGSE